MLAVAIVAASLMTNGWPFVTIRHADALLQPERFEETVESVIRHPGCADELWFWLPAGPVTNALAARLGPYAPYRDRLKEAGLQVGMQQYPDFGNGHDLAPECRMDTWRMELPDDIWQRDAGGNLVWKPCPRSPVVQAFEENIAETAVRTAAPASIWLDDDLCFGYSSDTDPEIGCFCERCIRAFNAEFRHDFSRTQLVARLSGGQKQDVVRREWRQFKGKSLALFGAAYRRGVDRVDPSVRLGIQTVMSFTLAAADSYLPLLKALAGGNGRTAGIRPGSGQYLEDVHGFFDKSLAVAREAERCRRAPCVGQVCYEQENYHREVLHKSAEAMMIESAMALAAGCDALSEYWWDAARDEPVSYFDEFVTQIVEWRPYFRMLADVAQRTHLGGLARFRGSAAAELVNPWISDPDDRAFARCGVPVTVADAGGGVFYVNRHSLDEWGEGDAERIAAAGAVVDETVWDEFLSVGGESVAAAVAAGRIEKFPLGRAKFLPNEWGGRVPTVAERTAFLDALDRIGPMPVRVERSHPLYLYPRTDDEGRLRALTVLNISIGKCLQTRVRLRRPCGRTVRWYRPCEKPIPLAVETLSADEIAVTVPGLPGSQVGTLVLENAEDADAAYYDRLMAAQQAAVAAAGVKWIDGRDLPIEGRAFDDVEHYYDRLPANLTTNVCKGVREMKHHTAGMQLRFSTDSRKLTFRWTPYLTKLAGDIQPASGASGIDVYRQEADGKWHYVQTGRITSPTGGVCVVDWRPGDPCLVNLPLYNGVRELSLGIDRGASVSALPPRRSGVVKPVVFYGTSITHGGCASRPGMSFVNIVGRELDVPVVNLGFSASGFMEFEMSEHIARIDASCYVLDCLWNMNLETIEGNYEAFTRNLRRLRPDVPILFAGPGDVHCGRDLGYSREMELRNAAARKVYDRLVAEGWPSIAWLEREALLGTDGEGTVDGVHPSDLGMRSMATAFEVALRNLLHLNSVGVPNQTTDKERTKR